MGASGIALQQSFTNCKLIRDIAPEWDMWKSRKKSTEVEAGRLSVTLTLPNLFMFSEISFIERQNENYITQFFRSEENSTRLFSIYCPSANVDQLPPNICKRKYTQQRVKQNYKILEFEVSLMISSWLLMHFFIHSFFTYSFNTCNWSPPTSWALQLPKDKTHPSCREGHSAVEDRGPETDIQSSEFCNRTKPGIERNERVLVLSGPLPGLGQVG